MLKEVRMSVQNTQKSSNYDGATYQADVDTSVDGMRRVREQSTLWKNSKRKCFQAKEVIYRESEAVDRICIIRSGLVKLLSYLPNGRARIVRLHARDQWIGLEGLLGQNYEHTAIAIDDVVLQHVPIHSLKYHLKDEPGRLLQLLKQWHVDLSQADRWISEFSTGGIRPRVARLLEYLAELEYGSPADTVELLTVCEMSEILGVTPESVSRIVATFKRRNILKKQAESLGEVYRLDTRRLQQEARK
jgi:CRP/FNR family transcriptional regulator